MAFLGKKGSTIRSLSSLKHFPPMLTIMALALKITDIIKKTASEQKA